MTTLDGMKARIEDAKGIAGTLGACWDAFELIQQVAGKYVDPDSDLFYAFLSAMTTACEGRDAVGFAPSMPSGVGLAVAPLSPGDVPSDDAADIIAQLASQLTSKLTGAAALPCTPGDRQAFQRAAASAAEIRDLLSGQ
ncbi:MAG: hypothetical protein JO345_29255 [Streptosporangiaceae bacterium]|nr:hypothetical protein [Streptosporangiaceae bacterium]